MQMRFIFLPKHQRLVNQCYPPGNNITDKKSKSSETSYLLYYVNSRRSKLEKVSSYLIKKNSQDMHRRRVGNVAVTLEIMSKIVVSCKENLNVFIKDFFHIMLAILSNTNFNNDVSLLELLELTFGNICANVDSALLNGDSGFVKHYSQFVDMFFEVVQNKIHQDDLLLKCCNAISITKNLASNPQANHYIQTAVTFTLVKFQERNPKFKFESLSDPAQQNLARRLSRIQTRPMGADMEDVSEDSLEFTVLQSFFNTDETDKLTLSIRALVERLLITPNKELLAFVCNRIPVQLRYIVILLLIRQLNRVQGKDSPDVEAAPTTVLKLISSLLISDVSIIGLSVLDVLKKILQFQMDNLTRPDLVAECCATIRDLNMKSYYQGQAFDIVYEILLRLKASKPTEEAKKGILVRDVEEIIKYSSKPFSTLELLHELAPYMGNAVFGLLDLLDTQQHPSPTSFVKLFSAAKHMDDYSLRKMFVKQIFVKYGKYALLGGLSYVLEDDMEPDEMYYLYHTQAAKFLKLKDYQSQVEFKQERRELFTRADLINYYSDPGSNPYSEAGSKILLSLGHAISAATSTTELYPSNRNQMLQSQEELVEAVPVNKTNFANSLLTRDIQSDKMTKFTNNGVVGPKHSVYRLVSDDARSWKMDAARAPKVSDLKNALRSRRNGSRHPMRSSSVRGSQSVKSAVTNITFLLSELKSNIGESEREGMQDPDEEDIVGLDKIDIARAQSVKLRPPLGDKIDHRKSLMALLKEENLNDSNGTDDKTPANNNGNGDVTGSNDNEDDKFTDAEQAMVSPSNRGMMFSTA
ncbi:Efr3p KNAG_0J02000 [Huiozyma naganishii CBS 8797]|uniref:Protein EFR3 n=1 Tax=Huiozyma naganishii (strain ATCC MYA-139 / BCRC 22969 / CBS 8797 / KCTC 17520 / NBRC 10181 / NCYC 3082 / Yp74L-3) TaxID=1071383 RepID=J7SAL6_HUIN7|nr:hypothetical protein KNAG_0J02000 [Kazachstania naganishii CBS 8797]CCK72281.1 hypothetical protein KNAG_0J02000 [Kazachstania naganishii CBS 8797]